MEQTPKIHHVADVIELVAENYDRIAQGAPTSIMKTITPDLRASILHHGARMIRTYPLLADLERAIDKVRDENSRILHDYVDKATAWDALMARDVTITKLRLEIASLRGRLARVAAVATGMEESGDGESAERSTGAAPG